MPRPKYITVTPVNDVDGIAASQTPAAGGVQSLTLAGALISDGKAVFLSPHRIGIASAGDDSGRTFTVTGKGIGGQPLTESVTGANAGTANTANYFLEVSSITTDDDTAGAITAGVSGLASSPWYPVNRRSCDFGVSFGCELVGSSAMTYTVEHTFDDLQNPLAVITTFDHDSVAAKSASDDGNYEYPPSGIRLIVTSFTSGTIQFNIHEKG